jgi:hypothetical protein
MSPRYFAKFTGSYEHNAGNWYHFTPSQYDPGTYEEKIHKSKALTLFRKIFRIKPL